MLTKIKVKLVDIMVHGCKHLILTNSFVSTVLIYFCKSIYIGCMGIILIVIF